MENGVLTKENTAKILGHSLTKEKLMVKGADGKPQISTLAKGRMGFLPPEKIKELANGGFALDVALMKKMDMLQINAQASSMEGIAKGTTRQITDMEKLKEIEAIVREAENATKSPVMNVVTKGREI